MQSPQRHFSPASHFAHYPPRTYNLLPMSRPPTYLGSTLQKNYYLYILTDTTNTFLYTGVTSNLERRVQQHKSGNGSAFTKKYNVNKLVYYEILPDPAAAIAREKQIKAVSRQKRMDLVNSFNAAWRDLSDELPLRSLQRGKS